MSRIFLKASLESEMWKTTGLNIDERKSIIYQMLVNAVTSTIIEIVLKGLMTVYFDLVIFTM